VLLAAYLAEPRAAKLIVLRVLPIESYAMSRYGTEDTSKVDSETERLQAFVGQLFSEVPEKPEYEPLITFGAAPHRKIAEIAADHEASLIVMGAHGGGIRHLLFGGVAERTRRCASCPVVTIGAGVARSRGDFVPS
jgi:nucleotide-binding universal stress UspA family protein